MTPSPLEMPPRSTLRAEMPASNPPVPEKALVSDEITSEDVLRALKEISVHAASPSSMVTKPGATEGQLIALIYGSTSIHAEEFARFDQLLETMIDRGEIERSARGYFYLLGEKPGIRARYHADSHDEQAVLALTAKLRQAGIR